RGQLRPGHRRPHGHLRIGIDVFGTGFGSELLPDGDIGEFGQKSRQIIRVVMVESQRSHGSSLPANGLYTMACRSACLSRYLGIVLREAVRGRIAGGMLVDRRGDIVAQVSMSDIAEEWRQLRGQSAPENFLDAYYPRFESGEIDPRAYAA